MRTFIDGSQAAWEDLAERARHACVVFRDCQLPPGCTPGAARVGVEVLPSDFAVLYVARGIRYEGSSDEVRAWLAAGERRFTSFDRLRDWIVNSLGPLYGRALADQSPAVVGEPRQSRRPDRLTDLDAVVATIEAHTGVVLGEDDLLRELKIRVYGQDEALKVVARRVSRHVGRSRPRKPTTMFALGPTGVGKTRTAEALAESVGTLLGGRWSSFLRLNMNEYQERHRVSQLLGAPPSYIGYGEPTHLIDRLVAQPESIILFDEIEKAHPDILVALMSAMDVGELTSPAPVARGRTVDCRRAVFFFTSNIEVTEALADMSTAAHPGESTDAICRRHLVGKGIKQELVGRIGAFLVFQRLSARSRAEIATAAVARAATEYGLTVMKVDPEIISGIVNRPYDDMGARPDEYYIDDLLGPVFAQYASAGGERAIFVVDGAPPVCVPADTGVT
jgi:hypothetical protein